MLSNTEKKIENWGVFDTCGNPFIYLIKFKDGDKFMYHVAVSVFFSGPEQEDADDEEFEPYNISLSTAVSGWDPVLVAISAAEYVDALFGSVQSTIEVYDEHGNELVDEGFDLNDVADSSMATPASYVH